MKIFDQTKRLSLFSIKLKEVEYEEGFLSFVLFNVSAEKLNDLNK